MMASNDLPRMLNNLKRRRQLERMCITMWCIAMRTFLLIALLALTMVVIAWACASVSV